MRVNLDILFVMVLIMITMFILTLLNINNINRIGVNSLVVESSLAPDIEDDAFNLNEFVERQTYNARLNANFEYIHPKFKKFNSRLDASVTNLFINIMIHYDLDKSEYMRSMYTGQILLESGARQFDENGDVVTSYAGAVGITQIMPQTCLYYLKSVISSSDSLDFINLGVSDFSFVNNNDYSIKVKTLKAKKWLSSVKNNIILWGYITNNELDITGNVYKQLVSYNTGIGGMYSFIKNGGNCLNHVYVSGIRSKLLVASE